jgi:hypothetical protein
MSTYYELVPVEPSGHELTYRDEEEFNVCGEKLVGHCHNGRFREVYPFTNSPLAKKTVLSAIFSECAAG